MRWNLFHWYNVVRRTNGSDDVHFADRRDLTGIKHLRLRRPCVGVQMFLRRLQGRAKRGVEYGHQWRYRSRYAQRKILFFTSSLLSASGFQGGLANLF